MRSEFGERAREMPGHLQCSVRGLRAPQFAAGEALQMLERFWENALAELKIACGNRLSPAQWSALVKEFWRAKAELQINRKELIARNS